MSGCDHLCGSTQVDEATGGRGHPAISAEFFYPGPEENILNNEIFAPKISREINK